jgi:serine protease Do
MRRLNLAALCLLATATYVQAEDLHLTGKKHWLAIASDKDKDVAIGIARRQYGFQDDVRVVFSKSGFYGVIAGPYEADTIQQLKTADKNDRFGELPKDALLSGGANYTETVWQPVVPAGGSAVPYTISKTAEFSTGALSVKVMAEKPGSNSSYTVVDGKDGQGTFHFDLGRDLPPDQQMSADALTSGNYNQASVVKLLAKADTPQVIITNFSGGAHCCTDTTILAREQGSAAWAAIKGTTLDGSGYWFEDVDGDGGQELLSVDNAFNYAFGSYADSNAPIKIARLSGGKLEDVSEEPEMHSRLLQDLAGMEFSAKLRPELWQSNGFLAGWVAAKIRLGQGDAAWAKFMANYDKQDNFGPQTCETGQKVDNCPSDQLKAIPIPKALAEFLRDNGYAPLPKAAEAELK